MRVDLRRNSLNERPSDMKKMKNAIHKLDSLPYSLNEGEVNAAFSGEEDEKADKINEKQEDPGLHGHTGASPNNHIFSSNQHSRHQDVEPERRSIPDTDTQSDNKESGSPSNRGEFNGHMNLTKPPDYGHRLLGQSISSYLENRPGSDEGSHSSGQFASNSSRSRNSSTSQQGDSGVCSEATSVVEPFNHIINNSLDVPQNDFHQSVNHNEPAHNLHNGHDSLNSPNKHTAIYSKAGSLLPGNQETPLTNVRVENPFTDTQTPYLQDSSISSKIDADAHTLSSYDNHCLVIESEEEIDSDANEPHIHFSKRLSPSKSRHSSNDRNHPPPKGVDKKSDIPRGKKWTVPDKKTPRESICSKYTSCRWKLAYLCFLARFVQTALRQCMGIAIIGMTWVTTIVETHPLNNTTNSTDLNTTRTEQEFNWGSVFEGVILSSFNVGSIITPIIVGYLTTRYGGRKLMTVCLFGGGLSTILLPVAARWHPALIIVFRIFTGISLSGTDSLIQAMWARWAPVYEKASLASCAYTGLNVAGVLTFLVCGYIGTIGGEGKGWPYIFYIFGSLTLLLVPVWWYFVHDSPESHPRIKKRELAIIAFNKSPEIHDKQKPLNTPWKRILKSPAVWVILMGHVTHKWILSFMLSYLPRYFADLFHFDLETDGLYSSLPFAGRVVSGVVAGYLSDWLLVKGFPTGITRKTFQTIGCWGCALFSLLIAFAPSLSSGWSISFLVLALSFQNFTSVAFRINLLDIAPRYAGLLNGVISTVATLASLPAPVVTSLLISGGSRDGWQIVFCLVAGFNIVGGLIFVVFAKGEIQDWALAGYVGYPTDSSNDNVDVFVSESSGGVNQTDLPSSTEKPFKVREVKSLPANTRRPFSSHREPLSRRASNEIGAIVRRVRSHSFTDLAFADL